MRRHVFATWLLALSLPFGGGCGHDHDHNGHSHDHHHGHVPLNGGSLVVLADEFANVEVLVDPVEGTFQLWSFDAHVELPERLTQTSIVVSVDAAEGPAFEVTLDAVASALTGESVGDSSYFRGRHDALVGLEEFSGSLGPITSRGREFPSTAFTYPVVVSDADHDHAHE